MLRWIPIVFAFACAPDGGGEETPLGASGYLAASWVSDAESTNTYVAVVDSLEIDEIDYAAATGGARAGRRRGMMAFRVER